MRTRKPFQIKGRQGWQAEYRFQDGQVRRTTHATPAMAQAWLDEQRQLEQQEQQPLFGGPSAITLGQMLGEYAARNSLGKLGAKAEIDRINHYVQGAGLPLLRLIQHADGRKSLTTVSAPVKLRRELAEHRDKRMAARAQTYAIIEELSRKKASQIIPADIRLLVTRGQAEKWSNSTLKKEVALLKAAYNTAITEWKWTRLENPCVGIKLGKYDPKVVMWDSAKELALAKALATCDNLQFWVLVELAIETTLRRDGLLSMRWSKTNLESRRAVVYSKGKQQTAFLTLRAVELLKQIPRGESDLVFPMSPNAVNMAWEGVRKKAEPLLDGMTFRDLRHVAATKYARAGMPLKNLAHIMGHTSTRMVDMTYANLTDNDHQNAMDAAGAGQNRPLPPTQHANGKSKPARPKKPKSEAKAEAKASTDSAGTDTEMGAAASAETVAADKVAADKVAADTAHPEGNATTGEATTGAAATSAAQTKPRETGAAKSGRTGRGWRATAHRVSTSQQRNRLVRRTSP